MLEAECDWPWGHFLAHIHLESKAGVGDKGKGLRTKGWSTARSGSTADWTAGPVRPEPVWAGGTGGPNIPFPAVHRVKIHLLCCLGCIHALGRSRLFLNTNRTAVSMSSSSNSIVMSSSWVPFTSPLPFLLATKIRLCAVWKLWQHRGWVLSGPPQPTRWSWHSCALWFPLWSLWWEWLSRSQPTSVCTGWWSSPQYPGPPWDRTFLFFAKNILEEICLDIPYVAVGATLAREKPWWPVAFERFLLWARHWFHFR